MGDQITFKHDKYKVEIDKDGNVVATTTIQGTIYHCEDGTIYLREDDGKIYELVPVEKDKEEISNTDEVELYTEFNCSYNPKDYTKEGDN